MSDMQITVDRGGEQVVVGVEDGETALVAALHDRADESTVDELVETLENELRHTARLDGGLRL